MSILFDPHDLDPEEYGETQTTLETDHESAIERVRKVCLDAGFDPGRVLPVRDA